jgi:hypothetical protein
MSPPFSECRAGGGWRYGCLFERRGLISKTTSTRIDAYIMHRMSSRLRDVNEDTSDKLHGVENLGLVSVVPGFYLVENLPCIRLVMDPPQADGRAEHIEGQSL